MSAQFPPDFYEWLRTHTRTGVKGGLVRPGFLEIWIVTVGQRVFARSWDRSARSWFTTFVAEGIGELRYGSQVIPVLGHQVPPGDPVQAEIHASYRARYTDPDALPYVTGITQPEYEAYTLEFLPDAGREPYQTDDLPPP
ncbi:MAG: DUF2255 family protein [Bacteroidia bacterium]|nr:DUF2255 family protein [Bacteroidia bacterium]